MPNEIGWARSLATEFLAARTNIAGDDHVPFDQPCAADFLGDDWVLRSLRRLQGTKRFEHFGRILAIWIFVIALIPPIAGAYISLSGLCPIEQMLEQFQKRVAGLS